MNKRQRKKLEKQENQKIMNEVNQKEKDENKMTNEPKEIKNVKEVKKETTKNNNKKKKERTDEKYYYKKLPDEEIHFIATLIDRGHGNNYILREFKEKFGENLASGRITHIRRGQFENIKEKTKNYNFAKVGYPTFNEYKKILREQETIGNKVDRNLDLAKTSVKDIQNKTEEAAKDIKNKMSNIQKSNEDGKEYRDNVDVKKAGKPQETIFDKIMKKVAKFL